MSGEASAIWMWVAMCLSTVALVLLALWRIEKQFADRAEEAYWECSGALKDAHQTNEELVQLCRNLQDANTQLMAIIHEQDNDQGESWKHEP